MLCSLSTSSYEYIRVLQIMYSSTMSTGIHRPQPWCVYIYIYSYTHTVWTITASLVRKHVLTSEMFSEPADFMSET